MNTSMEQLNLETLFKKIEELRQSGSMIVCVDSILNNEWCVILAQNFGESDYTYINEGDDLKELLCQGIKEIERERKRQNWKVY
jgi:hypothetical protein